MAEIRKQALLASGAQIEGLQAGTGAPAAKKVVYGNRKKKGPSTKDVSPAPSRPRSPEPEPEPVTTPTPPPEEPTAAAAIGAQDDWDTSTDDEAAKSVAPEGVKDSWDASSDEEGEKVPSTLLPTEKVAPTLAPNKLQVEGKLVISSVEINVTELFLCSSSEETYSKSISAS
jgi:translation initiation factor 5B